MSKTQLEFPQFKKKQNITIQVDSELLKIVRKESKIKNLTLRQVVEYGMRVFLKELDNERDTDGSGQE